jgi:D-threo-aldose 1-dehydrogenase
MPDLLSPRRRRGIIIARVAIHAFQSRSVGRTSLRVTQLGFGTATLGDIRATVSEAQASATIEAAWAAGVGFFDTAPWYGRTKSEHRLGAVLRTKPRDSYALSTKVGRVFFRPPGAGGVDAAGWAGALPFELRFDYTRAGVLRSYEDSLQRLGIPSVDALLIHDLDAGYHGEDGVRRYLDELDAGGGFAALSELKEHGEIAAIGAGINVTGMIPRFLERFPLDVFIVAMPYTLLNQDALEAELALCVERGASVVIGAPFASGILAIGPREGATYGYRPAEGDVMARAQRIDELCQRFGVPLGAAALQFPFGHPAVVSIIPGPNAPEQVRTNLAWLRHDIPPELWASLKAERLIHPDAPTP